MDALIGFIIKNPTIGVVILILLCLGGLVQAIVILDNRFGLFGNKGPTMEELLKELLDIKKETFLTNNNHLSQLPDAEREIYRIGAGIDKMNDTLIRIETRLTK